jgi:hypothetical protein
MFYFYFYTISYEIFDKLDGLFSFFNILTRQEGSVPPNFQIVLSGYVVSALVLRIGVMASEFVQRRRNNLIRGDVLN